MIHFLVTADHTYPLSSFFDHWGRRLRQQVRIVHYESRSWRRIAPSGTWVFTDLERLSPAELAEAQKLFQRLASDGSRWRPLNDPSKVLRRHALLKLLAERGINSFQAYSVREVPATLHFPVFIRAANDHKGALSSLLADRTALERALGQLPARSDTDLLVVEYCPYDREDGLFVKRSVMRVGAALIPRHMLFSRHWQVKDPDHIDAACVTEEEEYLANMPHASQLRDIFDLAGIEYGRIDYTVVHDRIQVFEINTNPMLVPRVFELAPCRWPSQARSAIKMLEALEALQRGLPEPRTDETYAMQRASLQQGLFRRLRRGFGAGRP
jgi:hypothetical protein